MTKEEVSKRVLLNGKPLPPSDFFWNESTKEFSSEFDLLVIDFKGINSCTFDLGWKCTINAGCYCTFKAGSNCVFNTKHDCAFETGHYCVFNTECDCTFKTESRCAFKTGWKCTFDTKWGCIFDTGWRCAFKTEWDCTFNTGSRCIFKTGENCVVVRRDIFEIIELKKDIKIKLNDAYIKGYTIVTSKRIIVFNGKEITLSEDSYQSFVKQFKD